MKKKMVSILLLCIMLFLYGCGTGDSTSKNEELIVGSWSVIGVMYEGEYVALTENEGLADLYDTNWITAKADKSYNYQNGPFSKDGTWERYENDSLKYTFLLTDEDGSKKLAGVLEENTSAMIVYDFSYEEDQVMLVYGKDGKTVDNFSLDESKDTEDDETNYTFDLDEDVQKENDYEVESDLSYDSYNTPTAGEERALQTAWDYLNYSAFSYSGLIEQLEYEGFSTSEATYAVKNCGADWYEQAVLKAQEYLDYSSFSRSGLVEQLEYEGFTYDQAVYGVDKVY